ncbi:MAG: response regulator transcription factor [Eubacteriales bacterium]
MPQKVFIIEDEENISQLIKLYFEKEGFDTLVAGDGLNCLELIREFSPDLIFLDIMLPQLDGFKVLEKIRQQYKTPVIMLTAKVGTEDKLACFEYGADDYIVKPFNMQEVLARAQAVLRRSGSIATESSAKVLSFDRLEINLDSYDLIVNDERVDVPPKELELLFYLASTPNRVFTRNQLLDEVWGYDFFGDTRTIDVHVKRLRVKLENISPHWSLRTVWGVGYKFEVAGKAGDS